MAKAACPFCFRKVDTSRLAYQCTNRGNQTCVKAEDPLRVKLTQNRSASYPTAMPGPDQKGPVRCSECGGECRRRACPECHTAVPSDFVDSDSPMIGIVGSKGSGKTVLMTAQVKQLSTVVGKRFGASVRISTDDPDGSGGVEAYKANREDALFVEGVLPLGTEQNAAAPRRPLVLTWQGQKVGLLGRQAPHSTVLSFVDTAGEDLNTIDDTFTLQYLTVCDGLIVALDPFALPGARSSLNLPPEAVQTTDGSPLEVIDRVTELLRTELGIKRGKKIKLPVAFVFTKIDAFYSSLAQGNPILRTTPNVPVYSDGDGQAVHENMRALLHSWGADDIDLFVGLNYADHRYFGVSALGAEPDYASRRVASGGVQPHRIEDPILWLLAKEKAVPRG